MGYRVISGFQDLETEIFYDVHTIIDEKNKNLKKYLDAGVVIDDTPKKKEQEAEEKKSENKEDKQTIKGD